MVSYTPVNHKAKGRKWNILSQWKILTQSFLEDGENEEYICTTVNGKGVSNIKSSYNLGAKTT